MDVWLSMLTLKYLGTTIDSLKDFCFSAANDLRNFYISANSILNTLHRPNEEVLMQLLYTNCVPVLSYASAVKDYKASEMHDCNIALNKAIRRIFSFNRWKSICILRQNFGHKSLTEIFAYSKRKCFGSLSTHGNSIVSFL